MNLKQVYEIFYPPKNSKQISIWNKKPKYCSKKDFYESLIPIEIRWLNIKLWNDKARRSRFLSNSKAEITYTAAVLDYIIQFPLSIPRMENKGKLLLKDGICANAMNEIFFEIIQQEHIVFSSDLNDHLIESETGKLKQEWGNVLTYLFLYAIFPEKINQLYAPYLYGKKNNLLFLSKETEKDNALFQYEYPPDMGIYHPGDIINHTWVIKNTGSVPWKNRYYECDMPAFSIGEKNEVIHIPKVIYPGDVVSISVCFEVPDILGSYDMSWKMKDKNGKLVYPNKFGLGLHFTILEKKTPYLPPKEAKENNYEIVEEFPTIPATLEAGKMYSHVWKIQNTGTYTWKDYYCECTNGESFRYTKNELKFPLKKLVKPGEHISVKVEFVTPPVEGIYRFVWRIFKSDGCMAFAEERKLEILLTLI